MPFVLSSIIKENFKGMWFEGAPYIKENIYDIHSSDPKSPPVNYNSYTLKPHSLPHIESSAHTQKSGRFLDSYYQEKDYKHFFGKTVLIKLEGNHFQKVPVKTPNDSLIEIWHITTEQITEALFETTGSQEIPPKLIIGLKNTPINEQGFHDPSKVLILSQEAADMLAQNSLELYGTSWKSSDFMPGKKERPIHNTLFKTALIMECLDLSNVPAGSYFMSAFPIPLEGASESVVCPVLFSENEIKPEVIFPKI